MKPEEDWGPIETIVLFFLFLFVYCMGELADWRRHRQYCDCKQCTAWRAELSAKAERKRADET